jgi:hypothetical protein
LEAQIGEIVRRNPGAGVRWLGIPA